MQVALTITKKTNATNIFDMSGDTSQSLMVVVGVLLIEIEVESD